MTPQFWVLSIILVQVGMIASGVLRSKFSAYSRVILRRGITGREVAEKMLRENGIYDVKVVSVQGFLSDHYNPATKTVNLSPDVYNGASVAAAAVAAHECGHAVQHATAYGMLQFRSAMVPVQNITSQVMNFIFMASLFGGKNSKLTWMSPRVSANSGRCWFRHSHAFMRPSAAGLPP